jgi:hypothetical protein
MKIVVFPQLINFHTGDAAAHITVSKLVGLDPLKGFKRDHQRLTFVARSAIHQCPVKPGIYEVQAEDGTDFLILVPHRIGLTIEVAQELLRNPFAMAKPTVVAQPIARAMTDLIFQGLSWAAATRALGLGPHCEVSKPPNLP